MTVYLTIAFYLYALMLVLVALFGVVGLFLPPVKPEEKKPQPANALLAVTALLAITIPWYILIYRGFLTLDLPMWIFQLAIAIHTLTFVADQVRAMQGMVSYSTSRITLSGFSSAVLMAYVAWVGLQTVTGA
jgi:hypothetical protein